MRGVCRLAVSWICGISLLLLIWCMCSCKRDKKSVLKHLWEPRFSPDFSVNKLILINGWLTHKLLWKVESCTRHHFHNQSLTRQKKKYRKKNHSLPGTKKDLVDTDFREGSPMRPCHCLTDWVFFFSSVYMKTCYEDKCPRKLICLLEYNSVVCERVEKWIWIYILVNNSYYTTKVLEIGITLVEYYG